MATTTHQPTPSSVEGAADGAAPMELPFAYDENADDAPPPFSGVVDEVSRQSRASLFLNHNPPVNGGGYGHQHPHRGSSSRGMSGDSSQLQLQQQQQQQHMHPQHQKQIQQEQQAPGRQEHKRQTTTTTTTTTTAPHRYDNLHAHHFYPRGSGGSDSETTANGGGSFHTAVGGVGAEEEEGSAVAVDFVFGDTYVTVCESDGSSSEEDSEDERRNDWDGYGARSLRPVEQQRADVLAVLLSGAGTNRGGGGDVGGEKVVGGCEEANASARAAADAMKRGDTETALGAHTRAAKLFRDMAVAIKEADPSLANSLLILSKTQARSGLALKRILKKRPSGVNAPPDSTSRGVEHGAANGGTSSVDPNNRAVRSSSSSSGAVANATTVPMTSQTERLRATVRGALGNKNEADITDSTFLGTATSGGGNRPAHVDNSVGVHKGNGAVTGINPRSTTENSNGGENNPVDDMMMLERELRDMDMALELGSSIASLGARTAQQQTRAGALSNSTVAGEGSFHFVPTGSSYMSSTSLWASGVGARTTQEGAGTAGVRARANRLQTVRGGSGAGGGAASPAKPSSGTHHPAGATNHHPAVHNKSNHHPGGLESSWWGHGSVGGASHLASSLASIGSHGVAANTSHDSSSSPANTKQLMNLLDSLKTLGDENASLLREVEDAQQARLEAKAAREQMKQFKADYGKRFKKLNAALDKFRKDYPDAYNGHGQNPVTSSDFVRSTSASEVQKKDETIQKLTADLKKEKEESKKKDAALRKYESFYREVKARSAQKALQRQKEQQQQQQHHVQQQQQRKQKSKVDPSRLRR